MKHFESFIEAKSPPPLLQREQLQQYRPPLTAHASRDGSQIVGFTPGRRREIALDAASGAALGQTQLDLPGISANELSTGGPLPGAGLR